MAFMPLGRSGQSRVDPRMTLAQSMIGQSQNANVQTPLGAIARVLASGIGGLTMGRLQEEQEGKNRELAQALGSQMFPLPDTPGAGEAAAPSLDPNLEQRQQLVEMLTGNPELARAAFGASLKKQLEGPQEMPATVREWEFYNSLSPEDQQRFLTMKRAEKYINLRDRFVRPDPNNPGAELGSFNVGLPPDRTVQDGRVINLPAVSGRQPGGFVSPDMAQPPSGARAPVIQELPPSREEQRKAEKAESERRAAKEGQASVSAFTLRDAREIQNRIPEMNDIAIIRKSLANIPGTTEYGVNAFIESMRGTIGIEQLLNIKRQGSGLGQVPQAQLNMLADLMGRLDIGLPKEDLKMLIGDIQDRYQEILGSMTPEDRSMVGLSDRELGALQASPLDKAREAIANGADPEAVKQRLRENGIDPSGL